MKKKYILIIFFLVTLNSCNLKERVWFLLWGVQYAKSITKEEKHKERQEEKLTFEEASRRLNLWWAINVEDVDKVKQYLEEGYDPNKSRGEQGYRDRNPLNIIAMTFYNTYVRIIIGEKIPAPPQT